MVAAQHILQQEGLKYSPDMVLTAVFVGNDIGESLAEFDRKESFANNSNENGRPISWVYDSAGKPFSWRLRKFLGANFHSYVFLTTRLNILLTKYKLARVDDATIDILREQQSEVLEAGWRRLQDALIDIQTISNKQGMYHLVLIIPLRHQVNEEEWKNITEAYQLDADSFSIDKPQKILGDFLQQQNIDHLDLLPLLREAGQNPYYEKDPHFNAFGHKFAADALHQFFIEKLSAEERAL